MADSAIGKSRTTTIAQQSKDERPRDGLDVSGAFAPVVGLGGGWDDRRVDTTWSPDRGSDSIFAMDPCFARQPLARLSYVRLISAIACLVEFANDFV
jgi:hypothetical protein